MKPTVLAGLLQMLVLSIWSPTSGWTQWSVSLGVESDRFWGGSLEKAPEQKSFRPYRPTVMGAALEHRFGAIGAGVRLRYAEASLGLEGREAVLAVKGAFTILGMAPEVNYQMATLGPGNRLLLHLGPLLEFWHPADQEWRTRLGLQGAVSLAVPLGTRLAMSLESNLAVISSPFQGDELLEQYDRRALWRRGFSAALQYRI
jgi:hypothetical protein